MILYEDTALVVVDKPAGLSSEDGVPAALRKLWDRPDAYVGVIHRLDTGVSGLMVYAKTPQAAAALSRQVTQSQQVYAEQDGRAEPDAGTPDAPPFVKQYRALIAGGPDEKLPAEGVLRDYLFKDSRKGRVFPVSRPRKGVKEAVLEYRISASAPDAAPASRTSPSTPGAPTRYGCSSRPAATRSGAMANTAAASRETLRFRAHGSASSIPTPERKWTSASRSPGHGPLGASDRKTTMEQQYKTDSEIYAVLEREIIDLTLRPGCSLSENPLCNRFGAPRSLIRVVLQRLQENGLVKIVPYKGTTVTRLNRDIVDELIYERIAVEARVLRDFAPHCTPEHRSLIRQRAAAYDELAKAETLDFNRLYEADTRLHETWFSAMGKMYLWRTLQNAHADYSRFRMLDTLTTGGLAEVVADHHNLIDAIERCDLAAFEPLVERHLYGGIRRLGSKLTEEYADYFE